MRQAHLQIALEKGEGIDERGRMVQTGIVEACASQCDTSASLQILLTFQDAHCESILFWKSVKRLSFTLRWQGEMKDCIEEFKSMEADRGLRKYYRKLSCVLTCDPSPRNWHLGLFLQLPIK